MNKEPEEKFCYRLTDCKTCDDTECRNYRMANSPFTRESLEDLKRRIEKIKERWSIK